MNLITMLGAVLIGLLASLPALVHKQHWEGIREFWKQGFHNVFWDLAASELGTVVVTYCNPPYAPSTTPLTAAQASQVPEQQAQILWSDADTQAIFVHNWGLNGSFPTWLWPQFFMVNASTAANSFATNFTFGLANTNQVYITKVNVGTGSGGTYNVYLRRPHSVGW